MLWQQKNRSGIWYLRFLTAGGEGGRQGGGNKPACCGNNRVAAASGTLGSLFSTLILPHARLCSVRRSSLSSMPEASRMSSKLRLSTSLKSIKTTACNILPKHHG